MKAPRWDYRVFPAQKPSYPAQAVMNLCKTWETLHNSSTLNLINRGDTRAF